MFENLFMHSFGESNTWSDTQQIISNPDNSNAVFSKSCDIDFDGNTIGIGGSGASIYVFTRSGTTWTLEQKLTKTAPTKFGDSISISNDGNTLVGGDIAVNSSAGTAYVFTRSGTTWVQEQELIPAGLLAGDEFGSDVSISGTTGNTIIVGAPLDSAGGDAYVFTRSGTTWTLEQKLTAYDNGAGDEFGESVDISDDGNTAIVGCPKVWDSGAQSGAAYVFTRSGTTWTLEQKLIISDTTALDWVGEFVSISSDGDSVIISQRQGHGYVFTRSGTTWTEEQKLIPTINNTTRDITSVDIDGDTVLIGVFNDNDDGGSAGAVFKFSRSGTTWTQDEKIITRESVDGQGFGNINNVTISGDELYFAAGHSGQGEDHVHIYFGTITAEV